MLIPADSAGDGFPFDWEADCSPLNAESELQAIALNRIGQNGTSVVPRYCERARIHLLKGLCRARMLSTQGRTRPMSFRTSSGGGGAALRPRDGSCASV